tara:strand:+ start:352 stop:516 length:165 start_codon:yes stop_codon:yes gene_type:complete
MKGVKIGTKEESFWTGTKKQAEQLIETTKHEREISEHLIKLCDMKIAEENKDRL